MEPAFSTNRLSLLDLSEAANQPFFNDNYVLSYNGEIYNFREIRKRLAREYDLEFRTSSDTEVLFYSLIHDGIDKCLDHLRGMFAFAFYDQEHERLYLARDRMGIKPLYYYQTDDNFYWASEIKAIVKPLELVPDPVRTLFAANNMAERSTEYTLFKKVRSVRPGAYMNIDPSGRGKEVVYYDVVDDFDSSMYRDIDDQPAYKVLSTFDEMFTRSVDSMLVSDAPIGAFVSGGIDSSLISAIAVKCNADVKLFTANVIGRYSEYSDVEILSKHLNKQVFESKFEREMVLRDWVDVTYYYECPIVIHVNAIPFAGVAKLAHDSGVKAVLTGEGADELFLGYPDLLARRYRAVAAAPVNALKSIYRLYPKLHKYLFPEAGSTPLAFINNLVQGFHHQRAHERTDEKLKVLSSTQRAHQHLTISMIREHLVPLVYRNDRVGMMSSIEARFPFLDEEIVKFAVNLPAKYKAGRSSRFHNYKHPFLIDKWIVRKTASKYLPDELVSKTKNGFPMYGHKFIKVKKSFFENGWVIDALGLDSRVQEHLISSEDPYFVAKLASVEIFGRIFGFDQPLDDIKDHVGRHAEIHSSN